jgi:hypothetical protein
MSGAAHVGKNLSTYLAEIKPTVVFNNDKEDNVKIFNLDIDYLIKAVEYIKLQQNMAADIIVMSDEKFNLKYANK